MPTTGAGSHEPIDFATLAAALLDRAGTLVPQWLPGGDVRGHEYICANLQGGRGRSCSVNLTSGVWADFSSDEKGGDLISLAAAIRGLNNGQAARELMREMGWERVQPAPPPAPASPSRREAEFPRAESAWRPIAPVPEGTPKPSFRHYHRGDPVAVWEYVFEQRVYGYVCRFTTSDGGKEILPYTWCEDLSDGRGTRKWTWKQWDAPRPLFVPATLLSAGGELPVVLVEGEKCAAAGHGLIGHEFDWVSWPGGSKAWEKADWAWLQGRAVYLWPDCDAKRQRLTKDEREAGVDPQTKPLLPEDKQPGMQAMVGIGALLARMHGCTVFMCPVPQPGAVSDGWDVADAIEQGWDAEQVRAFIRGAREFVAPEVLSTPSSAGAGTGDLPGGESTPRTWRSELLRTEKAVVKQCRENVVLALDGLPDAAVPGIAAADGVIAFNEFTNDVMKLRPAPWGTSAGVWQEEDELELGNWLARRHSLPSMPRTTLEEAVVMVSKRHRFHPVRAYLDTVRGRWDGEKRLRLWLRRTCLEEDEWDDSDPLQQYLARVGTWFLMAMCARVLTPGVKFDYMLIFEGPQGVGKSTLARTLGGEWFADTNLVLGDKDAYQVLQGVWVQEIPELDAFSRQEVTKVKAFVSSPKDRFRASFDRRAKDYPRQCVFIGTTNEDHYLTDATGNRRFWPVSVTRQVDLDWLREHRDQMFAEALHYLDGGARFHPTHREQRALFDSQQQSRTVESAIETAVTRYLYDEKQKLSLSGENGTLVNETTLVDLLQRVGIALEKLGPGRFHEKQAAAALRKLGWTSHKSSRPGRPLVWRRPEVQPPVPPASPQAEPGGSEINARHDAGASTEEADDACPF